MAEVLICWVKRSHRNFGDMRTVQMIVLPDEEIMKLKYLEGPKVVKVVKVMAYLHWWT
jgi:hypothetical protein